MKSLCWCFAYASLLTFAQAQIKTSGVKTRYPASNSGNLIAEQNRSYSNADTYQDGDDGGNGAIYQSGEATYEGLPIYDREVEHNDHILPQPTENPIIWDTIAAFLNHTRSKMASGICYKEVPTSTLLINKPSVLPVGNGTTPDMTKIQICCEGYERNPHVFARCEPVCKDDCPNGICTAPDTCVCLPDHVPNHVGKCVTKCPIGCGNGMCDDYNSCQCHPGYTLEPMRRQYCVPYCEHGCQFGICVEPNKCECQAGYRPNAAGVCEPKCDDCENGECTAPGYCSCNEGYMHSNGRCEPVCRRGCLRGRCVAPDNCQCDNGFQLDSSGSQCVPHCDQPCLNGVCDGPNTCRCNMGFTPDDYQRNICRPHCAQGCPNGYCTAPNICICKPGFTKSGVKGRQSCVPA